MISTTPGRRFAADDLALVREMCAERACDRQCRLYTEVEERAVAARVLTYVAEVSSCSTAPADSALEPGRRGDDGSARELVINHLAADVLPDWHEIAERIPIGELTDPGHEETVPFETPKGTVVLDRWRQVLRRHRVRVSRRHGGAPPR